MNHPPKSPHPRNQAAPSHADALGWQQLISEDPGFRKETGFPIPAYSEFMPPPRLGLTPYGDIETSLLVGQDPFGWQISEVEEEYELRPGVARLTRQIMEHLLKLGQGQTAHSIAEHKGQNLKDNPYWPSDLAARSGQLQHEHYVAFLPLALSRAQDDKGRVLWTFFGGSEHGPEPVFWKGFFSAPGQERPAEESLAFILQLLANAYEEAVPTPAALLSKGFRILPTDPNPASAEPLSGQLPSWTRPYLVNEQASFDQVRYLLTFRPFSRLPEAVKGLYLEGRLHLLPFPGSLVFWGMPTYLKLQRELPMAVQIPLLRLVPRSSGLEGLRVPQTGWLHEPREDRTPLEAQEELLLHTYSRSNRWDRIHRYEDELALNPRLEKVAKVLFSTDLEVLGLYDKPMARNCQLWNADFGLLLDGPRASPEQILEAENTLANGGLFGYRFLFPAMRVGRYEVYWHRLAVAYRSPRTGSIELLPDAPLGYLTASPWNAASGNDATELWPRLARREVYLSALQDFHNEHDHYAHQTSLNLLSLLDARQLMGERRLPRAFARTLLRLAKEETLEAWIAGLPDHTPSLERGRAMQAVVEDMLERPGQAAALPHAITYNETATRAFETAYWEDIQTLSNGDYKTKETADVVQDAATLRELPNRPRDLERLGDYLLQRHREAIRQAGMQDKAVCGELPFSWQTDFNYPLLGGWMRDHEGMSHERDLLVVIPGRDRTQAVILADHYDTAYEEDTYDRSHGGSGAHRAAAGADDNCSATTVLLQSAPIYLKLSSQGRLERDIWLLHLTGEEFPADCMGARHFCQALIEKTLRLHLGDNQWMDLSGTRPMGIFVMDMIAHNRDHDRDIFQISPGRGPRSLSLAWQAHLANLIWNAGAAQWNQSPERRNLGRGQRSQDGSAIPPLAAHLALTGEVRMQDDPASSLYNTDGQIFSDIGAPVVLFMENYDINRSGYHDTHDTMNNIDLDYGAALAAIAIESGARMAVLPEADIRSQPFG
ncbi:MAG: M28 family peptidase [Anaerolineales bacterium]